MFKCFLHFKNAIKGIAKLPKNSKPSKYPDNFDLSTTKYVEVKKKIEGLKIDTQKKISSNTINIPMCLQRNVFTVVVMLTNCLLQHV